MTTHFILWGRFDLGSLFKQVPDQTVIAENVKSVFIDADDFGLILKLDGTLFIFSKKFEPPTQIMTKIRKIYRLPNRFDTVNYWFLVEDDNNMYLIASKEKKDITTSNPEIKFRYYKHFRS